MTKDERNEDDLGLWPKMVSNSKLVKMATDINETVRILQKDGEPDSRRFSVLPRNSSVPCPGRVGKRVITSVSHRQSRRALIVSLTPPYMEWRAYGLSSRESGLYRTSLNLPSPAMLFSNGEEQPSTASSPQSTSETPDSMSSDIAEPSSLPSDNWNLWNPLLTASNQITLEDIIHESAIIELAPTRISPPFHADCGPGRPRIFNRQILSLPRKIIYSIVTRMNNSTLYTRPKLPLSRPKRLLSFMLSHQPLSSMLLRPRLVKRLPQEPQRLFYDRLILFGTDFRPQYAINHQ